MNLQLIQGEFSTKDTLELITQMIQVKIKYHENKISHQNNEEDIKTREFKIKSLQKELNELKDFILLKNDNIKISAIIKIE